MRSLPATGLAEAHAVYGISLDPVSARLAVISQLAAISPNRSLRGGGLLFKQAGWNRAPDGQTFWDGGGWYVHIVWHEDGKRCEREATGATPEEALTCLEQALLAEIQDPDTLTAARAAVVAARESREEIPPNLRRPEV